MKKIILTLVSVLFVSLSSAQEHNFSEEDIIFEGSHSEFLDFVESEDFHFTGEELEEKKMEGTDTWQGGPWVVIRSGKKKSNFIDSEDFGFNDDSSSPVLEMRIIRDASGNVVAVKSRVYGTKGPFKFMQETDEDGSFLENGDPDPNSPYKRIFVNPNTGSLEVKYGPSNGFLFSTDESDVRDLHPTQHIQIFKDANGNVIGARARELGTKDPYK